MSDPFYIDPDDALLDLQQTIANARRALARVHPDLGDVERPYWLPPPLASTSTAVVILGLADILARAVDHYLLARHVGGPSPS
ncbi:MAG TPA: hypothetical protein ENK57_09485 [Polyangiaceae bacterium]|nr:hypothetical protein [Polyangiaceae bacterium]